MSCSDFPRFCLHSGGAEENGHGIFDRFLPFQERRLKTTKLYHKTQQRGNNLFAREYQHVTQCRHQKKDVA